MMNHNNKRGIIVNKSNGRVVCILEKHGNVVRCLHCNNDYDDMYRLAEHITRLNKGSDWDIVEQKGMLEEFM